MAPRSATEKELLFVRLWVCKITFFIKGAKKIVNVLLAECDVRSRWYYRETNCAFALCFLSKVLPKNKYRQRVNTGRASLPSSSKHWRKNVNKTKTRSWPLLWQRHNKHEGVKVTLSCLHLFVLVFWEAGLTWETTFFVFIVCMFQKTYDQERLKKIKDMKTYGLT
jgi:hypothetical protein